MIREYPYTVVPESYRRRVSVRKVKNQKKITNQIVLDLLDGKTLLVDAQIPIHTKNGFPKQFRTLYTIFASRGYKLHCYIYDDVDTDTYRAMLMWAEPLMKLWVCSRCAGQMVTGLNEKPTTKHCNSEIGYHFWKKLDTHTLIEPEELAA